MNPKDLAVRIIPCLDVDDGRVVKGVNFENLRDAGDPVELAAAYDREGADELTFLDVTASSSGVVGRRTNGAGGFGAHAVGLGGHHPWRTAWYRYGRH
jgi:hypothetical protein